MPGDGRAVLDLLGDEGLWVRMGREAAEDAARGFAEEDGGEYPCVMRRSCSDRVNPNTLRVIIRE